MKKLTTNTERASWLKDLWNLLTVAGQRWTYTKLSPLL